MYVEPGRSNLVRGILGLRPIMTSLDEVRNWSLVYVKALGNNIREDEAGEMIKRLRIYIRMLKVRMNWMTSLVTLAPFPVPLPTELIAWLQKRIQKLIKTPYRQSFFPESLILFRSEEMSMKWKKKDRPHQFSCQICYPTQIIFYSDTDEELVFGLRWWIRIEITEVFFDFILSDQSLGAKVLAVRLGFNLFSGKRRKPGLDVD